MPVKKNSYITFELDWLVSKAEQLKKYVDDNPFDQLENELVGKTVITKGAQLKSLIQALKDYAQIIEMVDKMREIEEIKQTKVRGTEELTPIEHGEI